MGDRRGRPRPYHSRNHQIASEVITRGITWLVLAVAFLLNVGWEMAQMFAYVSMSVTSRRSLAECLLADC